VSFSPQWLALREPADRRARDPGLLAALAGHFAARDAMSVVDLGCGTGSNLRAIAPVLPARQEWRLVDNDPALLAAARARIAEWADAAQTVGADLHVRRKGLALTVRLRRSDLAADLEEALGAAPDLVSAAALFDLVSAQWISRFVPAVAARGAVFYGALTYDGREEWRPPHPADAAMLAAFNAHQTGDKGFGPAVGRRATDHLVAGFSCAGYRVRTAESPWRLDARDGDLVRDLALGAAAAVRETGRVPADAIADWLAVRRTGSTCVIGHLDCLAVP
jgi:SAM-dependent methyltransferase